MKYIIMCGGPRSRSGRPLQIINKEPIIGRTIRLLQENNVKDIALSTHDERYEQFNLPILKHFNPPTWDDFVWLRTFYPMQDPVCYIFGDVFFSPEAIKTIVNTQTDSIEFFASAPPFSKQYIKRWAEPFSVKVKDTQRFFDAVELCKELDKEKRFKRSPATVWELWQVIKGTPLNRIVYTNYTVINDYTCDIDNEEQKRLLEDRGVLNEP